MIYEYKNWTIQLISEQLIILSPAFIFFHSNIWHFHSLSMYFYWVETWNPFQNSFLTEDDCKNTCPAYENPCGNGELLLIDSKPKRCNPEERCPQTYYCHIGADRTQNFCCRKSMYTFFIYRLYTSFRIYYTSRTNLILGHHIEDRSS